MNEMISLSVSDNENSRLNITKNNDISNTLSILNLTLKSCNNYKAVTVPLC